MTCDSIFSFCFTLSYRLVTSDWFKRFDKKTMWTQLFIYYCEKHNLFTLYINLPNSTTLASHWREKGEHINKTIGRDYPLAPKNLTSTFSFQFPPKLMRYGWDGNIVYDPAPLVASESLLAKAKSLQSQHGFVILQLLNAGYVEMTKSWICNVKPFQTVLPTTLFITTDKTSYDALVDFDDAEFHVVFERYDTPAKMQYGHTEYYRYMLFRTRLLINLLDANVTIWLTESDATWFSDPTVEVMETPGDMVTMNDLCGDTNKTALQGGFQLLRPSDVTKSLWQGMHGRLEARLKPYGNQSLFIQGEGNEQHLLDYLVKKDPKLQVNWLGGDHFVCGLWYKDEIVRASSPTPVVLLNNWISGNFNKTARAKDWRHWFLLKNGQCEPLSVNQLEQRRMPSSLQLASS